MGVLTGNPLFTAIDDNGSPLSGGLLYTYEEGTSTAKTTYADKDETIANSNPIVLDSNGEATIFLSDGGYKFVLNNPNTTPPAIPDDIRWTQDNITSINFATKTIAKTADYNFVANDLNGLNTFTNYGATNDITLYLPAGEENFSVRFIIGASFYLKVKAFGTENFRYGSETGAEGGYIRAMTDGTSWEIRWDGEEWVITYISGALYYEQTGTSVEGVWSASTPQIMLSMPDGVELVGGIVGLNFSINATDPANDIDITAGACMDSSNTVAGELATGITKQLDAVWAAGDAAGGLLNGTVAANTVYDIYALISDSDNSIDVGFLAKGDDLSLYLPTGYASYRYLGYIVTDATPAIMEFVFDDDELSFMKASDTAVNSATLPPSGVSTALDLSSFLPDSKRVGGVSVGVQSGGTTQENVCFGVDGANVFGISLTTIGNNGDTQSGAWGTTTNYDLIPISGNSIYWGSAENTASETVTVHIHKVKIIR